MTNVSRLAAEAYCAAQGKRLPTADEWEYAATLGKVGKPGDVWEWTAAEHHHGMHASHDASCAGAAVGAADPTNYLAFQRFALRSALNDTSTMRALGFRCAA
jgi:formylglycine-generating enzyme required for sulfatase activity